MCIVSQKVMVLKNAVGSILTVSLFHPKAMHQPKVIRDLVENDWNSNLEHSLYSIDICLLFKIFLILSFISCVGLPVTKDALDEVAQMSGVMTVCEDFLSDKRKAECERIIPDIDVIKLAEAADAYLFLKAHFNHPPQQQSLMLLLFVAL